MIETADQIMEITDTSNNIQSSKSPFNYNQLISILLILLIALGSISILFLNKFISTKNTISVPRAAKPSLKPFILPTTSPTLQENYRNPFDSSTQYQNQFSDKVNPFDNL